MSIMWIFCQISIYKNSIESTFIHQLWLPWRLPAEIRRVACCLIITTSSAAAIRPGLLGGSAYSAATAAVRAFSHGLNNELRGQGIRATVIIPGEVDTPILDGRPLPPPEEARQQMMKAEDIARCLHLAATLPHRTVIEELVVTATFPRDMTEELAAARTEGQPAVQSE